MASTERAGTAPSRVRRPRRKTEQLVLRIDPEQKALLEQAAGASGRTVTDIMTEGAREKALQIIREEQELTVWRLSRVDATFFAQALLDQAEPSAQMVTDYQTYLASRASRFTSVGTPDDKAR